MVGVVMDEQKIRTLFRDYMRNRILIRLTISEIGPLDIVIGDYSFQRDKKKNKNLLSDLFSITA